MSVVSRTVLRPFFLLENLLSLIFCENWCPGKMVWTNWLCCGLWLFSWPACSWLFFSGLLCPYDKYFLVFYCISVVKIICCCTAFSSASITPLKISNLVFLLLVISVGSFISCFNGTFFYLCLNVRCCICLEDGQINAAGYHPIVKIHGWICIEQSSAFDFWLIFT